MEMDYLLKDGIRKEVNRRSTNGKSGVAASRAAFPTRHITRCDAFTRGMLVLNIPNSTTCVPFEQLIERATRVRKTEKVIVAGKSMILVSLFFEGGKSKEASPSWNVDIYFDPAVNYLATKTVYSMVSPGVYRRADEVTQFKECTPGVFFPERAQGTAGDGSDYSTNHVSQLTDIRVNQALPSDIFSFRYPSGVYLDDLIKGTRYRVDPEGNPMSKGEPLARFSPPPIAEGVQSGALTETQEESKPLSRWILPASLCLVVLGLIVILIRRWRGRAQAS